MERTVVKKVCGMPAVDGAGVHLVRVLGPGTVDDFDPILMLDSFDSENPDDYTAGFPMHPHRGIETVSYVYKGRMRHGDSLGNVDEIADGEVQWMCAGSGIMHEEAVPAAERLLGVQLWLNLPAAEKMSKPTYRSIKNDEIREIGFEGGFLRLLTGSFEGVQGVTGGHLPLDYYDIHLNEGGTFSLEVDPDSSIMVFTLLGSVAIAGERIAPKTAAKLSPGDSVAISAVDGPAQVLFMRSRALGEPVAWGGPIVMNTHEQLVRANRDLALGTFVRDSIDFRA